jgi:SMI1 / KNR4 family (SUKH-1)
VSTALPLAVAEWREFLAGYSSAFLNSAYLRWMEASAHITVSDFLSDAQREAEWVGVEPADEQQLAAAEERLGVRLPPTYRNFLLTSNGGECIGELVLLPVDRVGWFAEIEGWLLDAWSDPGLEHFAEHLAVLKRCLLISSDEGGAGGSWLLHVDSADENGELTAYEWWPGGGGDPARFENFAALLTASAERQLA